MKRFALFCRFSLESGSDQLDYCVGKGSFRSKGRRR